MIANASVESLRSKWQYGRVLPMPEMVPAGWDFVRLTDIARLESGHTPSRKHPEYWDGDIPWVSLHDSKVLDRAEIHQTAQAISKQGLANSSARLLPAGTVVFSRTATVGKATVLGREMATSQDFANYICGPRIHNRYLLHLLRFLQPEWNRLMAGSTHNTIYMPVFENLQVLLPPLPEQRKIAAILSSVDDAIEATQAVIDQLHVVKKAMMAELLTRGLPGRHTRFKQTEIGEVPEGWEVGRLESLSLLITKGESPGWQGFEYQANGVLFVTSENVRDGFLDLDEPKFIPAEFAHKIARSRLVPGDILVNIVGASIGRAALWRGEYQEANVNQAVAVIRPMEEKLIPRILLDALYSPRGQAYFGTSKVDNARPNVSLTNLRDFVMIVPPMAEQQEIASIGGALDDRLISEARALSALQKTKSALSSALLTGEIRVQPDEATP